MVNKKGKINKKDFEDIIKNINQVNYLCYDFEINDEEYRQIKIGNEYIPYIISSCGRIFSLYYNGSRNIKLRQLKTNINKYGYERITLNFNGKARHYLIHVLVAKSFILNDDPINKTQVNHKNGIKTHNFVNNLEWCTHKENMVHAEKNNLIHHVYGINHHCNIYDEDTINHICELIASNKYSFKEISDITNVSSKLIYRIYKGRAWKSVSKNYDFTNFNKIEIKSESYKLDRNRRLNLACKLIESNLYTLREISEISGINYKLISQILNKKKYVSISNKYDFTNFNNYKKK